MEPTPERFRSLVAAPARWQGGGGVVGLRLVGVGAVRAGRDRDETGELLVAVPYRRRPASGESAVRCLKIWEHGSAMTTSAAGPCGAILTLQPPIRCLVTGAATAAIGKRSAATVGSWPQVVASGDDRHD